MNTHEALHSSLDHLTRNFRRLLAGKPVRDVSESLAAADRALADSAKAGSTSPPAHVAEDDRKGKLKFAPFTDAEVWDARREVGKWLNEETAAPAPRRAMATLCASLDIAAANSPAAATSEGVACSEHTDAPHGFDRDGSHTAGRYVCDCEGWTPSESSPLGEAQPPAVTQEKGNSEEPTDGGPARV